MKKIQHIALILLLSASVSTAKNDKATETKPINKEDTTCLLDKTLHKTNSPNETHEKATQQEAQQNEPLKNAEFNLQKGFSSIAKHALPSVVNIATTQILDSKNNTESHKFSGAGTPLEDMLREFMGPHGFAESPKKVQSLGSGFIIKVTDDHMFIVTNHHVIAEAKKISVFLHDKTEVDAELHASDERTDIAVVKIKKKNLLSKHKNIPALDWANDDTAEIGDWVLAIGNPFGLGSSVTNGIISSKGRDLLTTGRSKGSSYVDDFIQHSAQINMGNSGGCLLDMHGKVLGVNTAILSPSGGNVGVGFATPAGVAKKTVDQLIQFSRTKRGWLGVRVYHLTEDSTSALGLKGQGDVVMDVSPGGPADKAGLKSGDIIFEYNGKVINESNRITRLVGETEIGSTVTFKVHRKGAGIVELKTKIGEYEEALKNGKLDSTNFSTKGSKDSVEICGMKVSPLPEELMKQGRKGILITERLALSIAEDAGILPGDIIEQVNQKDIQNVEDFKKSIEEAQKSGKKTVLLYVFRGKEYAYFTLKFEETSKEQEDKKNQVTEHAANKNELPA